VSWASLLRDHETASGLFEGEIAGDATGPADKVPVTLQAFDRNQRFGPAPFAPMVDAIGAVLLPNRGDRCVVALAETDEPGEPEVWIIGWWPYD